jgi:hypothetical protein
MNERHLGWRPVVDRGSRASTKRQGDGSQKTGVSKAAQCVAMKQEAIGLRQISAPRPAEREGHGLVVAYFIVKVSGTD